MEDVKIFRNSSDKSFDVFLADLVTAAEAEGFSVHHRDKSDLVAFYRSQGVEMPAGYKHAMIQICKPENSGKALPPNPERSVFVQKFFSVYSKGGKTEVRFLGYSAKLISDLLGHNEFPQGPSDDMFAERMQGTFAAMERIVQAAV